MAALRFLSGNTPIWVIEQIFYKMCCTHRERWKMNDYWFSKKEWGKCARIINTQVRRQNLKRFNKGTD